MFDSPRPGALDLDGQQPVLGGVTIRLGDVVTTMWRRLRFTCWASQEQGARWVVPPSWSFWKIMSWRRKKDKKQLVEKNGRSRSRRTERQGEETVSSAG